MNSKLIAKKGTEIKNSTFFLSLKSVFFFIVIALSPVPSKANDSTSNESVICKSINKTYTLHNGLASEVKKALYKYTTRNRIIAVNCLAKRGGVDVIKPLAGLYLKERMFSPIKPEIINALVEIKGEDSKLALMELLKAELEAIYPIQYDLHPHKLAGEYRLIVEIMEGIETYQNKDVAEYFITIAKNTDEKWIDVITENAFKSYLIVSAVLNKKSSTKHRIEFYASYINGGNPRVVDFVKGKSGIKKFSAVQEYGARKAVRSENLNAIPDVWKLTKSLPMSKKREALVILMSSILANNVNNENLTIDKLSVVSWLIDEYSRFPKDEKFGSHFYLLQNLSFIKQNSQDIRIQKFLTKKLDENILKPVDLEALKIKVNKAQKSYERQKIESKPVEVRNVFNRMDVIENDIDDKGLLYLVNQLINKDTDVVKRDIQMLHGIAKSNDTRNMLWPYTANILKSTDNMDDKFLIDIAKIFSWMKKPGMDKELVQILKEENGLNENRKVVALFILARMHNVESLKLVPNLRKSASNKLLSSIDIYLSEFGIDTWMKSESEIDNLITRKLDY